jgi:hypothetical protein
VTDQTFLDAFFLAAASLDAGRPADALAAAARFEAMRPSLMWSWAFARARLLHARAEEALGRFDDARRIADELADLWRDADADYPPVVELAALRGRLRR